MGFSYKAARAGLVIFGLAASIFTLSTNAQTQKPSTPTPQPDDQSSDVGLHADISPYIWFAGMHGTVGALGHDTSVHASFGDIFNYLNMGLMGAAEIRYNRVVMPVDFLWMKLSDDKGLPITDEVDSVKTKITETMLAPKIGYRVISKGRVKVDALAGFRYWHLSTELKLLSQGVQVGNTFSRSANWVDGLGGARIQLLLTPKVVATIFGDAGGGGANLDYQVGGALGFKVSRRWVLLAGFRYLSVDYRSNGNAQFIYDMNVPGLAIGATYNIK
jgi:hypothetical protein